MQAEFDFYLSQASSSVTAFPPARMTASIRAWAASARKADDQEAEVRRATLAMAHHLIALGVPRKVIARKVAAYRLAIETELCRPSRPARQSATVYRFPQINAAPKTRVANL